MHFISWVNRILDIYWWTDPALIIVSLRGIRSIITKSNQT